MWKRILLFLSFLAGAIWQWLWEFIRALFYDRGSRMMAPVIDTITPDQIIHWGPTIVLPIIGLWLFWKTRPGKMTAGAEEMPSPLETKTKGGNSLDLTTLVEWHHSKLPEVFPPSGKICKSDSGHMLQLESGLRRQAGRLDQKLQTGILRCKLKRTCVALQTTVASLFSM